MAKLIKIDNECPKYFLKFKDKMIEIPEKHFKKLVAEIKSDLGPCTKRTHDSLYINGYKYKSYIVKYTKRYLKDISLKINKILNSTNKTKETRNRICSPKENNSAKRSALSFVRNEKEQIKQARSASAKKAAETRQRSVGRPSQHKRFQTWNNKEIDKWNANDFMGYYLNMYATLEGREDIDFLGKSIPWPHYLARLKYVLETYFFSDPEQLYNYMSNAMNCLKDKSFWMNGPISFNSLFGKNRITRMIKEVEHHISKKTNITKPVQNNRRQLDNQFASNDFWKNKLQLH